VPVLAPGNGKTKTGRLWTYVRDERPFGGVRPPAALFFYSPDRKGEHPRTHLEPFTGVLHADGYAGFNRLFETGRITEAGCWAHVRRKFVDVHAATASPIAQQALDRIGRLYSVEQTINGSPADQRRQQRQLKSKPLAEALATWAEETLPNLSRKSELAAAFRYMRARWMALTRCFEDGRLGLDNNPAERALRGVAHRPQKLSLCRLRCRRSARRRDVLTDRDGKAQRRQSTSLSRRRPRADRRPPGQTRRRTPPLELATRQSRPRRRLSRPAP
jgi:hypothetical protein